MCDFYFSSSCLFQISEEQDHSLNDLAENLEGASEGLDEVLIPILICQCLIFRFFLMIFCTASMQRWYTTLSTDFDVIVF